METGLPAVLCWERCDEFRSIRFHYGLNELDRDGNLPEGRVMRVEISGGRKAFERALLACEENGLRVWGPKFEKGRHSQIIKIIGLK